MSESDEVRWVSHPLRRPRNDPPEPTDWQRFWAHLGAFALMAGIAVVGNWLT